MTTNLLPNLILNARANTISDFEGLDSLQHCVDKNHFISYPYKVVYEYNSRGFRDNEWPDTMDNLREAIWCLGDSFTVGLGSPVEHTWPRCLQSLSSKRIINISMNGASNMWISRRAIDIIQGIKPKTIILHWSYLHRRESTVDTSVDDEQRRMHTSGTESTAEDDIENVVECVLNVEKNKNNTNVIHSFIPNPCAADIMHRFKQRINDLPISSIGIVGRIDQARDGCHYGLLTATKISNQLSLII